MVDGHAQKRQADGDVHARQPGPASAGFVIREAQGLHRDVPLIVIHGDDDIKLPAPSAGEQGVGGQGPEDVKAVAPGRLDGGNDRDLLLVAEEAVLARVRIEPAHRDTRSRTAKAPPSSAERDGWCEGPVPG